MQDFYTYFSEFGLVKFILGIDWLNVATILVAAFVARWAARRLVDNFVDHFMKRHKYASKKERSQRRDTLISVFTTITTVIITAVALVMLLSQLGVDLAAAATGIGALGVVLGIAGQSLFKNLFRGLVMIMDNQVRIGDIVMAAGVSGAVEEFDLLNTRLRDLDGTLHIVPNGEIIVLTNYSMGFANVNLDFRVSYDEDIDKVATIINKLGEDMASESEWRDIIKSPVAFLRVDSFGESGVNVKALGEVLPGEQWGVAGEFRKRLLAKFSEENVEIPLPQRIIQEREPASKKSSK